MLTHVERVTEGAAAAAVKVEEAGMAAAVGHVVSWGEMAGSVVAGSGEGVKGKLQAAVPSTNKEGQGRQTNTHADIC